MTASTHNIARNHMVTSIHNEHATTTTKLWINLARVNMCIRISSPLPLTHRHCRSSCPPLLPPSWPLTQHYEPHQHHTIQHSYLLFVAPRASDLVACVVLHASNCDGAMLHAAARCAVVLGFVHLPSGRRQQSTAMFITCFLLREDDDWSNTQKESSLGIYLFLSRASLREVHLMIWRLSWSWVSTV